MECQVKVMLSADLVIVPDMPDAEKNLNCSEESCCESPLVACNLPEQVISNYNAARKNFAMQMTIVLECLKENGQLNKLFDSINEDVDWKTS